MNKSFAYIRPRAGTSLARQRRALVSYALRNGLEITKWFQEKDRSACKSRPVFRRMMKDLRSGKAMGIISDNLERFSRNLREWAEISLLISHCNIEIHFADDARRGKALIKY
jgi:DNA invertase Pin-like site-specific DNA recombinase